MMLRSSAISRVAKRLSSTQALTRDVGAGGGAKTKLKNGLTVATVDIPNKHADISVFVKAGSRYESFSNLGISHCLRAGACLSTNKDTAFRTTQLLGSLAGDFSVTGSRDHITYNLRCGRKVWRDLVTEVVAPSLCDNQFYWWELNDLTAAMKHQIGHAQTDSAFQLSEAVHKASFRGGLSNSVLCSEDMIGEYPSEMAQEYFNSNFFLENMVLVGNGVNHDELCDVGESAFELNTLGQPTSSASEFVSSEVRQHKKSDSTHMGLSFPGSSLNDQDAIAIAVLQNILGSSGQVKRQSGLAGGLGREVAQKVNDPFAISTYIMNYSDCGLLGVYAKTTGKAAGLVLSAIAEGTSSIAKNGVSSEDVEAGKQSLKARVLMHAESSQGLIDDIGVQISLLGGYATPEEIASKIDAVTKSQVTRVAKKVLGGPKSLAVVGNTSNCPYLCDL